MKALQGFTELMEAELASATMVGRTGKVTEVVGTLMRVSGLDARLGEHSAVVTNAFLQWTPSRASESRCGVSRNFCFKLVF